MPGTGTMPFRIASAIPGRVRLQWTDRHAAARLLPDLAARLAALDGVRAAVAVADAGSVIVRYRPRRRSLNEMLDDIADTALDLAEQYRTSRSRSNGISPPALPAIPECSVAALHPSFAHHDSDGKPLLLSTAAVAAAMVELPLVLVGGVLALATVPLARRALQSVEKRRVSMELLDLTNLVVLTAVGDVLAAGQISWFINLGGYLRCKKLRHVRRSVSELLLREWIGRDIQSLQLVKMIEHASVTNAQAENEISELGDRLVVPLLGVAGAAYLTTGDPMRITATLKFADLASDARISGPAAVLSAMTAGARHGIFVRGGRAMEKLAQADAIAFSSEALIRAESSFSGSVAMLLDVGIRHIVMPAGESARSARAVASERGLHGVVTAVSARRTAAAVQSLRDQGHRVAILGDGSEGCTICTPEDVNVIVSSGSLNGRHTADVVLLHGELEDLVGAIGVAREAMAIIEQNKRLVAAPTAAGLAAAVVGLASPLATTVINQGAAAVAGLNSLRPLFLSWHHRAPAETATETEEK